MNKIIALNHKMNLLSDEVDDYIESLNSLETEHDIIVIPTSIYLDRFKNNCKYKVGSQNSYYEISGAYTGEISPKQLRYLDIDYVLLGHSERRTIFNENNDLINKKVITALNEGLKVILCIGESLEEKKNNLTNDVLKTQLNECLNNTLKLDNIIVAYEPIWSIGTGLVPNNEELERTITYIYNELKDTYHYEPLILYGGSVSETNTKDILMVPHIDGLLIGGASLKTEKIKLIINNIN